MARLGGLAMERILDGDTAVGQGPARYRSRHSNRIELKYRRRKWEKEMEKELKTMENKATTDYINEHCHPIEAYALKLISGDISTPMLKSSYSKTIAGWFKPEGVDILESAKVYERKVLEIIDMDWIWNYRVREGVLVKFPLLNLIKGNIDTAMLADLVDAAGGDGTLTGKELDEHAWGESYEGCAFNGRLSYADASVVSRKCNYMVVDVKYPCFV
jgi:hypothetical protein